MASFDAKIGRELPRKRENKNYCSVPFLHDALPIYRKFKKNIKKLKKLKKYRYVFFSSQNKFEKDEKGR